MSTKSKAYKAAAELVDKSRLYRPIEATKLAKETSSRTSTPPLTSSSAWALTRARLTSWFAAPFPCLTAPVRTFALLSSLRARRLPPLRKLALTSSAPLN